MVRAYGETLIDFLESLGDFAASPFPSESLPEL
jgi:hypothetical protein